jgi:hypothetical protein
MRTAIIYCGQARSISQVWENHKWHLRNLPEPSFFCSVADDAQADDMLLLRDHTFPGRPFHMEKVVQPEVELWPEKTAFKCGYPRSTSQEGVLKQLWAWNRAWEFFCEKANPEDFDVVVRIRPDTAFLRLEVPRLERRWIVEGGEVESGCPDYVCLTPRWAKWGGQQDRFAILGRKAAKAYFTTWQKLPNLREMGCPCHPEQLLDTSLRLDGITPSATLKAEFLTVRLPTKEHPDRWTYEPCDISGVDLMDSMG